MDVLKNHITGNSDKLSIEEQIDNITDNYASTEGYLNNNFKNMTQDAITNMEEKQQHRLEQLNNLSEKSNNEMF